MPYYIKVLLFGRTTTTANLANIALVLSGLLNAAVHIFLRANSERMAIRPREAPWSENRGIRILGPSDLNMGVAIASPLLRADSMIETHTAYIDEERTSPVRASPTRTPPIRTLPIRNSPIQTSPIRTSPLRASPTRKSPIRSSPVRTSSIGNSPNQTSPTQPTSNTRNFRIEDIFPAATAPRSPHPEFPTTPIKTARLVHIPRSRYSIYPTHASERRISWSTVTSAKSDEIPIPPALFTPRHARAGSDSATVQIGMRISARPPSTVSTSEDPRTRSPASDGRSPNRPSPTTRRVPSDESLVIPKMFRTPRALTFEGDDDDQQQQQQEGGVEPGKRPRVLLVNKSLPPVPRIPSELFLTGPDVQRRTPARSARPSDTWF